MAQNRMMPPALLEQLQGANSDVLRRVLEHATQRLIEAEAANQIGAGPHKRASTRTTYRNGYRERILDTGSGRFELQIPNLRMGASSRRFPGPGSTWLITTRANLLGVTK